MRRIALAALALAMLCATADAAKVQYYTLPAGSGPHALHLVRSDADADA